jgi:membrane protease YdiL (CAAX protease family)
VSSVGALLWTCGCHAALQLLIALFSLIRGGTLDIVTLGAAQALAYVSFIFLMLHMGDGGKPLRGSLGLRPTHPGLVSVGVGLGLALKIPAESLTAFTERFFPDDEAQLLARASLYRTDTLLDVAGLLFIVCLVAPLVEELFFRGALYGRLLKRSALWAGVVSGALFVVVHPDLRHWPALLVVALVLGYLRVLSGSLLPCLGLHVAFNAVGVLALVTGAASATRPLVVSSVWLATSWLGAALLLVLLVRLADNPSVVQARLEDRA